MHDHYFKRWNLILGWTSFAVALITYSLTVEPTVSFWDSGEYISTAAKLQVGHPPGAPLYQLIGSVFALFAFSKEKVALMVNMVSVFSASFAILFMYWSVSLLLKNIVVKFGELTKGNTIMILGSSLIGCLCLTFSDSFWFNATEAEVYAMASLFISLLMWAGLRWGEEMHLPNGNRWLLLISLLVGLSFGVHFLALLTIPSIGLIYYFKNYKTVTNKNFILANIAIVGVLLFVFKFLMPYTMALFGKTEIFAVNTLRLPFNSGTIIMGLLVVGLFYYGLRYTKQKGLPLYNTAILCILFMFIGFSSWLALPVRSNAGVVINEVPPTDATELLAYYNRENYGEQKVFYGPLYTEAYAGLDPDNPFSDAKPNYERDYKTGRYVAVNNYKNAVHNTHKDHNGILPRMISEKHAANYMAYTAPPKFRINPQYDFSQDLGKYGIDINNVSQDEAYAAMSEIKSQLTDVINEFKSAYNRGEIDYEGYDRFLKTYKSYLIVEKPTLMQNMQFMAEYQFGYMFWRYLMWNFAGKQNDVQGEGDHLNGNWLSGFKAIDEVRLGAQSHLTSDMLNNKGRNIYFFIPFILGLIGFIFHARKDPKSFYTLLVLFVFMSLAIKVFLNEKPFEVRERDYVMVGAFYVFAIWIAMGVYALYNSIQKHINQKVTVPVILGATLLAAPTLMAFENWDDHDRSGRDTALVMAKTYLDSCDPNAILFTIGDNDTFPLWYAQEIENFRTDIKVACSTYLPADWYIDQLKQKTYEAEGIPVSMEHNQYVDGTRDFILYVPRTEDRLDIDDFMDFVLMDDERAKVELNNGHWANYYPSNKIRIPVDKEAVIKNKVVSPELYDSIVPYIEIDLPKEAIFKHQLVMLDIIRNNNWERPIYFTGGSPKAEDYLWLKDYLQLDGMTYKLIPVKTEVPQDSPIDIGHIDTQKMYDTVMRWDWGSSNKKIYLDPETRRNSITYRKNLARLSDTLIQEGKTEMAKTILDLAVTKLPTQNYGYHFMSEPFAEGYYKVGETEKARELASLLIKKYQESITFFNSVDSPGDIGGYYRLLQMIKKQGDNEFYNKQLPEFDRYYKMMERFMEDNS